MPSFPLELAKPSALGLNERALDRLQELITRHIAEGRYPGAQVAMARGGKLALFTSFGDARIQPRAAAKNDTLWLLYSNTKVITACAVWLLVERLDGPNWWPILPNVFLVPLVTFGLHRRWTYG